MKEWIKSHRDMPLEWIFRMVNAKLRGHYQYYGVTDNMEEMCLSEKELYLGGFYKGVIENFSVNTATNQGKSVR